MNDSFISTYISLEASSFTAMSNSHVMQNKYGLLFMFLIRPYAYKFHVW